MKKERKPKVLRLKNITGRPLNVLCKERGIDEVFTVELPPMDKWTSETYIVSPNQEIENLLLHGYLQEAGK